MYLRSWKWCSLASFIVVHESFEPGFFELGFQFAKDRNEIQKWRQEIRIHWIILRRMAYLVFQVSIRLSQSTRYKWRHCFTPNDPPLFAPRYLNNGRTSMDRSDIVGCALIRRVRLCMCNHNLISGSWDIAVLEPEKMQENSGSLQTM